MSEVDLGVVNPKTGNVEPFRSSEWRACARCGVAITEANDSGFEVFTSCGPITMPVCVRCSAGKEVECMACGRRTNTEGVTWDAAEPSGNTEFLNRRRTEALERHELEEFSGWCPWCGVGAPVKKLETEWPDWYEQFFFIVGRDQCWDTIIAFSMYRRNMLPQSAAHEYIKTVVPEKSKRMEMCGGWSAHHWLIGQQKNTDYWSECIRTDSAGACPFGTPCKNKRPIFEMPEL